MFRAIALCSAKGGAGKSTLAASIGVVVLQEGGERVFLVDCDPQRELIGVG